MPRFTYEESTTTTPKKSTGRMYCITLMMYIVAIASTFISFVMTCTQLTDHIRTGKNSV